MQAASDLHFHLDRRELPREAREQRRQYGVGHVRRRPETDRAPGLVRDEHAHRFVVKHEYPPRVVEQRLAMAREGFQPSGAAEEPHADLFLQALHLLGHRRLRAMHVPGRRGEGFQFRDRDERAEQVQVESARHVIRNSERSGQHNQIVPPRAPA